MKVLADEIKMMKEEKKKETVQTEIKRNHKRIRIRPTKFKAKHLCHSSHLLPR